MNDHVSPTETPKGKERNWPQSNMKKGNHTNYVDNKLIKRMAP